MAAINTSTSFIGSQLLHLFSGGIVARRLQLVRRPPAAVGHASSEEGHEESQNAGEDGDQGEGSSGLDVGGHRAGGGVSLALHLPCGL